MSLNTYLQNFRDRSKDPAIVMLYKLKWAQIENFVEAKNLKILDFGSGFGTTANYFAKNHQVIAVEPNQSMVDHRECDHDYRQIVGRYEDLKCLEDESFDLIICHNVLEFAEERALIVREFNRLLKNGGALSIVKNNNVGRILSRAVFNDFDTANRLLEGGNIANTFGTVEIYDPKELCEWGNALKIEKLLALNAINSLQSDSVRKSGSCDNWMDQMFEFEMRVSDLEPFKSISLFNHVLLRKAL